MDQDIQLLLQRPILDILIGEEDSNSPLAYLSGEKIKSIGRMFNCFVPSKDPISRWKIMESILIKSAENHTTSKILEYLLCMESLQSVIEPRRTSETSARQIQNEIEQEFFNAVNRQLEYSDKKLCRDGNGFAIIDIDATPQIRSNVKTIDIAYVQKLCEYAQNDLNDGDFQSVVTKSRTILEDVFLKIIEDNGLEQKRNGKMSEYRSKALQALNMRPSKEWNVHVREFVGKMNSLVDAIVEFRNKNSDSHSSNARFPIKAAEAELLINTATNIGIYYLRVNDRQ